MRPSNEPLVWAVFSAGGVVLALLAPALIVLTGFVVPAEEVGFDRLFDIFDNPLVRLVLVGLAFLTFVHAAHRLRHTAMDLGLRGAALPIAVLAYGAAAAGTIWAATVAL
jgi:fumarate reductase subunit D